MDSRVLQFLGKEKVCSLAVQLPTGELHSAAVHFSHSESPFEIYFSTDRDSRKCTGLLNGGAVNASVVIGFSEQEWITLQISGTVKLVTESRELVKAQGVHYSKHPNSAKYKDEPGTVFLVLSPTWWRYTDYNTDPETTLSST